MQAIESELTLCIIKPNKVNYSEPFVEAHIKRLPGNKKVVYGGFFPLYGHDGRFLIRSKLRLGLYLFQKRVLRRKDIPVRTRAFTRYLREQNVDVVLAEYGPTGALATPACRDAGVPLVIHYHGFDAHDRPVLEEYGELYKESYGYASAVIGVSRDMCRSLEALGCPPEKINYNPYGVDLGLFLQVGVVVR